MTPRERVERWIRERLDYTDMVASNESYGNYLRILHDHSRIELERYWKDELGYPGRLP